ncbi:hypothetical protein HZI73_26390 (plasmid) [Vallitalea pronyensis]|uniref:Uncharacterized protein n=1 Tax=Vallitalea pronyensis TaxID=1348613 RepID=A0A8J8SJG7_9FIRM|nr:hypothetical protein [Vallitalea pronyensis]QUI25945.1 hypothetical protein HZI73_26390 [Vallitalea pronyensis]
MTRAEFNIILDLVEAYGREQREFGINLNKMDNVIEKDNPVSRAYEKVFDELYGHIEKDEKYSSLAKDIADKMESQSNN